MSGDCSREEIYVEVAAETIAILLLRCFVQSVSNVVSPRSFGGGSRSPKKMNYRCIYFLVLFFEVQSWLHRERQRRHEFDS
mmetsp:Transcript_44461/g.107599  ORF Transcript_44461/g.107599 Transcript_44461/m.107599 type:complete len:81 (+) Transcript_44461:3116-3358(+)